MLIGSYYIVHGSHQKSAEYNEQRTRANLIIPKRDHRDLQQRIQFSLLATIALHQHQHGGKILDSERIQEIEDNLDVEELDQMV